MKGKRDYIFEPLYSESSMRMEGRNCVQGRHCVQN